MSVGNFCSFFLGVWGVRESPFWGWGPCLPAWRPGPAPSSLVEMGRLSTPPPGRHSQNLPTALGPPGGVPPNQVQTPGHINSVGRNGGGERSILPLAREIGIPRGFCTITNSAKTGGLGPEATVPPEPDCRQPRSRWREGRGAVSTGEPTEASQLLLFRQREPAESHLSPTPSLHTCDPVELSQELSPQCLCIFQENDKLQIQVDQGRPCLREPYFNFPDTLTSESIMFVLRKLRRKPHPMSRDTAFPLPQISRL